MDSSIKLKIKQLLGPTIYSRAQQIFGKKNVLDLNFTHSEDISNPQAIIVIVEGTVRSDRTNERYRVGIVLTVVANNFAIRNLFCSCPYFEINEVPCKHIGAVLLKLEEDNGGNFFNLKETKKNIITDYLIKQFQSQNQHYDDGEKSIVNCLVTFIVDLTGEKPTELQIKIGQKELYIIKYLYQFLDYLLRTGPKGVHNYEYEVTKRFSFKQAHHFFSSLGEKIFAFLLLEYKNVIAFLDTQRIARYYITESRNYALSPEKIDELLILLKGEHINLKIDNQLYENIEISNEEYQPTLDVVMDKKQVKILNNENKVLILTKTNGSIFNFEKIFLINPSDRKTVGLILETMNKNESSEIVFPEEQTGEVITAMVPVLENSHSKINISTEIMDKFEKEPLVIETYFDFDGKKVLITPILRYGTVSFDLNNISSDPNRVVLRDYVQEKNYFNFISIAGFEAYQNNFVIDNLEQVKILISKQLSQFEKISTVFYSDNFKNVRFMNFNVTTSSFAVNPDHGLLEFNFALEGIEISELQDIFKAMRSKGKYHQLKDGAIIDLQGKTLTKFNKLFQKLGLATNKLKDGVVSIPKYHLWSINDELENLQEINLKVDRSFNELLDKIKVIETQQYVVPIHLDKIMREYQKTGYQWLKTLAELGFGGILADEMGLGKTLQAISFIDKEYELKNITQPVLIIAPASLIYNWKNEITKFAPNLNTVVIAGGKTTRQYIMENYQDYQILITSYPLLRRDFEWYENIKFPYCFIDEAQHIKNPNSITAKLVKALKTTICFALTGTPMENNLTELWSIFDFVLPGFLQSHTNFQKEYELPIIRERDSRINTELQNKIKPFILRRLKRDVMKELPDKIENKIIVEMTTKQKKIYAAYVTAAREELSQKIAQDGFAKSKLKFLSTLTRLRQICCDPSIINSKYLNESGKLELLRDIFIDLTGMGHKILLFSQFTTVLKKIEPMLKELGLEYLYLDGKTRSEVRVIMMERFNVDEKISVFLISLKAGGTGLNLTGADVVIHFDPWWNPSIENQATDRAHRMGQKKSVQVIKLITKGTIEEKIVGIQEQKQEIINAIIDGNQENQFLTGLSESELRNILDL